MLRGNLMVGAAGLAVVGLVYSQVMVMDSEDRYLQSVDAATAAKNYDEFRGYWRLRNGMGIAVAVIWLGSTLDAFVTPPSESAFDRITLELAYDDDSNTPMVAFAFRF